MEITTEVWRQIAALLYKYNISYTTNVTNDDKHIQINLTIPNYYEDKIINGEENNVIRYKF